MDATLDRRAGRSPARRCRRRSTREYLFGSAMAAPAGALVDDARARHRACRRRSASSSRATATRSATTRSATTAARTRVAGETATLDATGTLTRRRCRPTRDVDFAYRYTFEGDVEDVSRQHIANRASVVVHPAPWYIGLRRPAYFADTTTGTSVDVVAVDLQGNAVPACRSRCRSCACSGTRCAAPKAAASTRGTPNDVEVPAGEWTVHIGRRRRCRVTIPVPEGGYYVLARDGQRRRRPSRRGPTRRSTRSASGYTAWERYDHNRITLEPEKKTWKPGETRAHHDPVAVGIARRRC